MMCAAPLPFGPPAATACLCGIVAFLQDSRVFQLLLQSPDFRQCARRKNKTQQPEYKTATSHVTPPSLNEVPFTDRLHLPNRGSRITRCARSARQCYPCPRTKASPISPTVQASTLLTRMDRDVEGFHGKRNCEGYDPIRHDHVCQGVVGRGKSPSQQPAKGPRKSDEPRDE